MRVLFCHDGPLRKNEAGEYFGVSHNDKTFQRYYAIAKNLKIAIRVVDIADKEEEKSLSKITVKPFTVVRLPNISSIQGQLFDKKKVWEILKKEVMNTDYIVVRLPSLFGYMAFDLAQKYNIPCLVEAVACPWDSYWNYSLFSKFVAPISYFLMRQKLRKASHVIYVTNEFLQKRYPTNGKNTNCSNVALTDFDEKILEKRIEKIKNYDKKHKFIIATTAAVNVKFKGQQYIIKALGELKKKGIENYEYHLIGGGDQSYLKSIAIKNNIVKQVKFIGAITHDKVFNYLENVDIYVQPSRQEGLPRALIEAMSRGLPAFGAKTAGIPELLDKKFVFSNTKNNLNEICKILTSFNKETMQTQAFRNYKESKKYDKNTIEARRKAFFERFRDSIIK
jgi:glycosyltransferase involved in cell wall biosynthesis